MRTKRRLALWVALMLAFAMAGGASGQGEVEKSSLGNTAVTDQQVLGMIENGVELPISETPITVTCMYPRPTEVGSYDDMWFFSGIGPIDRYNHPDAAH